MAEEQMAGGAGEEEPPPGPAAPSPPASTESPPPQCTVPNPDVSGSSCSGGAMKRDDNPFSFRHFLKRDLSLPSSSTYERTGARPKTYNAAAANAAAAEPPYDTRQVRPSNGDISEIPIMETQSRRSLYGETDSSFYHRPNLASEPLGMPSLPDFVQDHILVEQAYLNSDGPIDLDNLPDFTFNTNFNQPNQPQCSSARRNVSFDGDRDYDYEADNPSTLERGARGGVGGRSVPVARVQPVLPLDLPPHLNLDLTESVNPADRRNASPRNTFPLDLPPNPQGTPSSSSNESMRLPDFLPVHTGRATPERPERPPGDVRLLHRLQSELDSTRSELYSERSRRGRLETELSAALAALDGLRAELGESRASEGALRERLLDATAHEHAYTASLASSVHHVETNLQRTATRATEAESTSAKLKSQIKKLTEELALSQEETQTLRSRQHGASVTLRQATTQAEASLRELLVGVGRLRTISETLDPP